MFTDLLITQIKQTDSSRMVLCGAFDGLKNPSLCMYLFLLEGRGKQKQWRFFYLAQKRKKVVVVKIRSVRWPDRILETFGAIVSLHESSACFLVDRNWIHTMLDGWMAKRTNQRKSAWHIIRLCISSKFQRNSRKISLNDMGKVKNLRSSNMHRLKKEMRSSHKSTILGQSRSLSNEKKVIPVTLLTAEWSNPLRKKLIDPSFRAEREVTKMTYFGGGS